MAQAKPSSNNQSSAREFKHRVLTCLNKLSDRDTHSAAATELESIAKTLNHDSISPFLSSISATDSSDKSPVRKQCVRLISTLSEAHGDALSSHLSKLLSAVIRRLRDPDTAVRSACVAATGSIASHVTKPPFTSVAKPLVDALVTEQELNSQIGVALCLASAVDGAPDPEPVYLRRMLPRIEKLLKCDSFKAKSALLTLLASVIGVGAASSPVIVRNLVNVLVEFVAKSEDWSARKAAAEALEKLAVVETDLLSEYKTPCLKTFEAKKFDKVKSVRETMTQMIEAWKAIPDLPEEVLTPPESQASSKGAEVASDGRYPARTPQTSSKRSVPKGGSSTTTTSRRVSLENNTKKTGPAMFRKLDRKKPNNPKLSITAATPVSEDPNRLAKQETKRALFNEIVDEETHESEYQNARLSSTVVGSNVTEDINNSHKDGEELSLIRNQLVQIETQQSNLVDLLQKFMGRSESGMVSLERRVHGLESTLEEISFDLARSTGRLSNPNPEHTKTVCCRLPGAQYLASKLWKKTEIQDSNGRIRNQENRGFHFRRQGLIKNPLAEVRHGKSEVLCVGV
ncbi:TORTIFOLIA1-like protein 4 [Lactuca sativa]|uniref:TORTIFOLIA1-like protein 4 n=1 Tax=Lactuca sativa TaxID=4236 RepID=UPI000CC19B21|nr:TORTIFOLIA1-like protein 4 [Lactuca sativa]